MDYSALPHSSGDELSTYVAEDVSFCDGIIFLEAGDNCPQRGVAVADQVFEPIFLCLARVVRLRITQCHDVMNIPYGGRKTRRLAAEPESALHYHATVRPLDIVCIEVVDDGDGLALSRGGVPCLPLPCRWAGRQGRPPDQGSASCSRPPGIALAVLCLGGAAMSPASDDRNSPVSR